MQSERVVMDTTTHTDQGALDQLIRDARADLRVAEMMASREDQTQREYIAARTRLMSADADLAAALGLVAE